MNNKKLTDEQLIEVAKKHNIEPAMLKAFAVVESSGDGFLPDGRPKILFEGHIFWRKLVIAGISPQKYTAGNSDILYEVWDKSKYKGGAWEYDRLEKAMKIHKTAALKSASWGMFQLMGFNHKVCGYEIVEAFVDAMYESEAKHLEAVINFLKNNNFLQLFADKNYKAIASRYNGPKFAENQYDVKLEKAYNKYLYLNA